MTALTDLIRGGGAGTLFLGALVVAAFVLGIAWPLALFSIKLGALGWRRLFHRAPRVIDITEGRRRQLQALASERTGR